MSIDIIPIWALFAGTILVVLISIEAGYWLGKSAHRKREEKESPVSTNVGAILGLSAFMLAFTFGIVWDRYENKKGLVRAEAVALRTAWQRSDFLPETDRAEAAALLSQYIDLRLKFTEAHNLEPEGLKRGLSETQRLQDRLWNMAVANARKDMNSDVAALYIESLNEMNGIHAFRLAVGIQARAPGEIWLALYCITILGMIGVGYHTGIAESKRSMSQPILAVSFAVVFVLIALLDRPDSGVLRVSQQPLIDLRDSMAAAAGRTQGE